MESGRLVRSNAEHTNGFVRALVGLPGGLLARGSGDSTVRLWEAETGCLVWVLAGHTGEITALTGLPGGLVASGSLDETVVIWRFEKV